MKRCLFAAPLAAAMAVVLPPAVQAAERHTWALLCARGARNAICPPPTNGLKKRPAR